MRLTATSTGAILAAGVFAFVATAALAQDDGGGGGLLPGASSEQKSGRVTTCSARNALGTKQCTSSCPPGQSADCADGDGGSDPTCECSGG